MSGRAHRSARPRARFRHRRSPARVSDERERPARAGQGRVRDAGGAREPRERRLRSPDVARSPPPRRHRAARYCRQLREDVTRAPRRRSAQRTHRRTPSLRLGKPVRRARGSSARRKPPRWAPQQRRLHELALGPPPPQSCWRLVSTAADLVNLGIHEVMLHVVSSALARSDASFVRGRFMPFEVARFVTAVASTSPRITVAG